MQESFNPTNAIVLVNQLSALSSNAIASDPLRGYTGMTTYSSDLNALKTFITSRYIYLMNHGRHKRARFCLALPPWEVLRQVHLHPDVRRWRSWRW